MTMPAERPGTTERPSASPLSRFFGGPPLSVIFRLVLLSILIGSAFWVLLSHDQPFVGTLSVSPKPLIAAVNAL